METAHAAVTTRLSDYQPPAYLVDSVNLDVDIRDGVTTVTSELALRRNPEAAVSDTMSFNGEGLVIRSLALDGKVLEEGEYRYENGELRLSGLPEHHRVADIAIGRPHRSVGPSWLAATCETRPERDHLAR